MRDSLSLTETLWWQCNQNMNVSLSTVTGITKDSKIYVIHVHNTLLTTFEHDTCLPDMLHYPQNNCTDLGLHFSSIFFMSFRMCTKLSKIKRKHFLLNRVLADSETYNWPDWKITGYGVFVVIVLQLVTLCALAYCWKYSKSSKGKFLSQCALMWCVYVWVFLS